jgi:hypothetical protein
VNAPAGVLFGSERVDELDAVSLRAARIGLSHDQPRPGPVASGRIAARLDGADAPQRPTSPASIHHGGIIEAEGAEHHHTRAAHIGCPAL